MPNFGQRSRANMAGMHPDLIKVFEIAITITKQDFGFTERQVRDLSYQQTLVNRGVSKTLKSNHLEQKDLTGKTQNMYGHAGDAVPWDGTKFVWEWPRIFHVASAFATAAKQINLLDKVCWGGVWDKPMSFYFGDGSAAAMEAAVEAYKKRHPGPDFIDGPHYQIYKLG